MTVRAILRIFAACAIVAGLLLGHSGFATCGQVSVAVSAKGAMAGGMDCCPEKQSVPHGQKCPLMALCSTQLVELATFDALPAVISRALPARYLTDEPDVVGLTSPPPGEPPRSTV